MRTIWDSITVWSAELTIREGTDYLTDLIFVDDEKDEAVIDMRGWGVEATIRPFPQDYTPVPFTVKVDRSGIHLSLDQAITNTFRFREGSYDVWLIEPGDHEHRIPLLNGRVQIIPRTTKWSKRSSMI